MYTSSTGTLGNDLIIKYQMKRYDISDIYFSFDLQYFDIEQYADEKQII